MRIYDLHQTNQRLHKPESIKFSEYSTNEKGQFIIDKNQDLQHTRKLINLQIKKYTASRFHQVIDKTFKEFTKPQTGSTALQFLENKINQLESQTAKTNSEKIQLQNEINLLKQQIENLQLLNSSFTAENNIPNTLTRGSVLSSISSNNMLLSKNRTAVAMIQPDGNFVVYTGQFDVNGNSLQDTTVDVIFAKGWDNGQENEYFVELNNGLKIGAFNKVIYQSPEFQVTRMELDDAGNLNLFNNTSIVWSTYGLIDSEIVNDNSSIDIVKSGGDESQIDTIKGGLPGEVVTTKGGK